jgi:hypothetical protein
MIADRHKGQSLVETLLANGVRHVAPTILKWVGDFRVGASISWG